MELLRNNRKTLALFFAFLCMILLGYNNIYAKAYDKTSALEKNIELNKEYTENIVYPEVKHYKFDLPSDGNINFKLTHERLSNSDSIHVDIFDKDGNKFKSVSNWDSRELEMNLSLGLPKGTYYFEVQVWGLWDDLTYNMSINFTQSDYFEKEFNDTLTKATNVELNKQYTGALSSSGDDDYYKFTLPSDGNINLKFTHEDINSDEEYWNVSIIDKNKKEIKSIKSKGSDLENNMSLKLSKGTYYIEVTPVYTFRTAPDMAYNLTVSGNFPNESFVNEKKQVDVSINKIWEIPINKELDIKTFSEKNIYITDTYGNIISIAYYADTKKIYIIPFVDYSRGQTYTLWVKNLKFKDGTTLKKYSKLDFQIVK